MKSMCVPVCLPLATVALVAMALLGGQPAAAGAETVQQAIAAANAEYQQIMNAAPVDADALASQFASDAYLLIPNLKLVSGRAAIKESIAQTAGQVSNVTLKTTQVKSRGNLAFELGTWSSTIEGRPSTGNYLALWRMEEGKWWRAGSCSVPATGANPLTFDDPGSVFVKDDGPGGEEEARLIGDESVWQIAPIIDERTAFYAETFNSGGEKALSDYVSTLYTRDAVVMIPEASLLCGLEAIANACVASVQAIFNLVFSTKSIEAGTGGEMAFALSGYSNDVQSDKGETFPSYGNYLAVWLNVDGDWKIAGSCSSNVLYTPMIEYAMK